MSEQDPVGVGSEPAEGALPGDHQVAGERRRAERRSVRRANGLDRRDSATRASAGPASVARDPAAAGPDGDAPPSAASLSASAPGAEQAAANGRPNGLEAPHRRAEAGSRIVEKTAVRAYRGASWLLAHIPGPLAWNVLGLGTQASYLAWSKKRRWVNRNFAHVLGEEPESGTVRRLALRAYRNYARYLVELMRLPNLPHDKAVAQVDPNGIESLEQIWRESGTALILVAGHMGNNEAVAAGIAWKGFPISVVADDSSFPEMFELLKRQRESWGVRLIPWRNLREVYGVLRRHEMLALLVDWGYRDDGIPVRLFGAWTTLPAGPAALAAKTGATILPIVVRRLPDGRFHVTHDTPIRVASSRPADVAGATQAIADALERTIAAAPEQWYSFKPIWPETPAERERLAERAANVHAGRLEAVEGSGVAGG